MLQDHFPVCTVCNLGVLSSNIWMDQDPLGREVGLGPGNIVLDGDPAPNDKGQAAPTFGPRLLWLNSNL